MIELLGALYQIRRARADAEARERRAQALWDALSPDEKARIEAEKQEQMQAIRRHREKQLAKRNAKLDGESAAKAAGIPWKSYKKQLKREKRK